MRSLNTALDYFRAGLCTLPANLGEKRPLIAWKPYQKTLPSETELRKWFADSTPVCIVAGAVSGNLEMLDFDQQGELFDKWASLVRSEAPILLDRLVIERSQNQGRHVCYRCSTAIPNNQKLAERRIACDTAEDIVIGGKTFTPARVGQSYAVTVTLIETRGEGGIFLCAPTRGYVLEQGSFTDLPTISESERNILIEAAQVLNEAVTEFVCQHTTTRTVGRPGDDFNVRGDIKPILERDGWKAVWKDGEREYLRRPGKESGWSATLSSRGLYVFSTNAAPFEDLKGYSPFAVYTLLEHSGNFSAAASALRAEGFGTDDSLNVDLSSIIGEVGDPSSKIPDPGLPPNEMFRIPGFVSEVMDHTLATAPYPNVPLAFCGALALLAVLSGRKVRDAADNRTNLYLLALAGSSTGKDWSRKVNVNILNQIGMIDSIGEKFASGEGIQDALFLTPSLLFQTDEIDGLLQSINKSKDARYEAIQSTLLTMYSSANSVYPMRRKAGPEPPGVIDQPCLVLYGTAIPSHYYAALSERMLTNGFFARTIIVESGVRGAGQESGIIDPPERVIETARWWSRYQPGSGNLIGKLTAQPATVLATREAASLLTDARKAAEAEYNKAEAAGDDVGTTVWGRVHEQARKLALLHAISRNHLQPEIDAISVQWAIDFVTHQARRMLFMASSHVADNPFHALCLKFLEKLRAAPDHKLPHSIMLKRMKIEAAKFVEVVTTLAQQGDIEVQITERSGASIRGYQLRDEHAKSGGG